MKEKNGEHPFGDAGQLIALVVFLVVWIGDSFVLHGSTFLSAYVPLHVRFIVLCLGLVTAVYLAKSGHTVVEHEKRPDHVVTTGAFHFVRHPLYLASLLTYAGLATASASLASFLVWAGMFAFYDYIAGYEEKLLEQRFGEEYRGYRERTGKWVPRHRRPG